MLVELDVVHGVLKQEAPDSLHVVNQLTMLPRNVQSGLCAVHGDTERSTVDGPDLIALAIPQLAVKTFGNVDTGRRAAKALIRCHPQTASSTRVIPLKSMAKNGYNRP